MIPHTLTPALDYIDPGTGSMLFALLIGLVGVAQFGLKGLLIKAKFRLSGGRDEGHAADALPLVIFSDHKRYWKNFDPVCRELDRRGIDVTYLTASPDDPVLDGPYPHIHGEFIGEGNRAFARMNLLNATMVLATTPGLQVYQWKRSKGVTWYTHMQHGANEMTTYRMFGLDYYDALLVSGQYQIDDTRALEALRELPAKEMELVGIPYFDDIVDRVRAAGPVPEHPTTVLVAPSWGDSAIFKRFGPSILGDLLATGYHIVVRPHPQSFITETDMIEAVMAEYPASEQLEWNTDLDNFDVMLRSDILISDFSGTIYEFSLAFDKPVICVDTHFDESPYDACWLDTPRWSTTAIPRLGGWLNDDNRGQLKELIDACLDDEGFRAGRREVAAETWVYPGEGAVRVADYLEAKYHELTGGSLREPGARDNEGEQNTPGAESAQASAD